MQKSNSRWPSSFKLGIAAVIGAGFYTYSSRRGQNDVSSSGLNSRTFTPFTLVDKQRVSETSSLLTLRPSHISPLTVRDEDENAKKMWKRGIWSVEIKQPQLMIARRYTPLPPLLTTQSDAHASYEYNSGDNEKEIKILIRRTPDSEVPRYLHNLPIGHLAVEVRGGYLEYALPEDVSDVVFLAGGTGIAPALQVARCLQTRAEAGREGRLRMNILWANRVRDDCNGAPSQQRSNGRSWASWIGGHATDPTTDEILEGPKNPIVQHLSTIERRSLASETNSQSHFETRYFIDQERSFIGPKDVATALSSERGLGPQSQGRRKLILVSGPDGFINYVAGPKRLVNGLDVQGPLGGLLATVDTQGWEVWKL